MKLFPLLSSLSVSALSLVMGLAISGNASAAFISCINTAADSVPDYNISSRVSTATGCTILGPLDGKVNDTLSIINGGTTESAGGFFGITNWLFDGKWGGANTGFVDSSTLFNFTGGGPSGTFSYVGTTSPSNIMFVFKDGDNTNLVGYRVPTFPVNGTYSTPFTAPPFSFQGNTTAKNVSHISVYYRNGSVAPPLGVPEPGVLLLMGVGLLGLAAARRKSAPA